MPKEVLGNSIERYSEGAVQSMRTFWIRWKPALVGVLLLILIVVVFRNWRGKSCSLSYQTDQAVDHVREYCNDPQQAVHGEEGEVTTMKDGSKLELLSVHAFIRHGDRNNLHSLPNNEPVSLNCKIPEDLMERIPLVREYKSVMENNNRKTPRVQSQTFYDWKIYPNIEICGPGFLTPIGATQHILNGNLFKQKYITKHKLFDEDGINEAVLMRSTDKSRTYQSGLALLFGFLPKLDVSKLEIQMATNASMCTSDTGHMCACSASDPFMDVMSATYKQTSARVRKTVKAERVYSTLQKVFDCSPAKLPRPSHILDVTMVHFCHGENLPGFKGECMPNWVAKDVYDILRENGAYQIKESDFVKISRLKMQPVLYEMADRMIKQGNRDTPLKFVLYSGHDSTTDPLSVALNFSVGLWSPYATRIVFELYEGETPEKGNTNKPLYIRVLFNGEVVTKKLPFCSKHIMDENLGLCPLDQFVKFVRKDNLRQLGESHYHTACSRTIGTGSDQ